MEPHAERSVTVTYDCPACKAASTAVVSGVTDPSTLMSGADASFVGRDALDALLLDFAKKELRYATCPRCAAKNPDGVRQEKGERRLVRWIGSGAFAALGVAVFVFRGVAYVAPALAGLPLLLTVVQVRPVPWRTVGIRSAFVAGLAVLAVIYPPACGALMIAEAIRFVVWRSDNDERWRAAAERIRFAGPYR